jgi:carbon storage regulator CsrA
MLVLTRKMNEQIQIGDNITVSILRIKGNTVRVGIQAPRQVRVIRGELPPLPGPEAPELASGRLESRGASVDHPRAPDGTGDLGLEEERFEITWTSGSLAT